MQKPPAQFDNYMCHNVRYKDPISILSPLPKGSSAMRCPLNNFVTCSRFSATHQKFLAALPKVTELKFYHEAVKDPKWRQAMDEEIQGLEKNET